MLHFNNPDDLPHYNFFGYPVVYCGDVGLCSPCSWETVRRPSISRRALCFPKSVEAGFLLNLKQLFLCKMGAVLWKTVVFATPELPVSSLGFFSAVVTFLLCSLLNIGWVVGK